MLIHEIISFHPCALHLLELLGTRSLWARYLGFFKAVEFDRHICALAHLQQIVVIGRAQTQIHKADLKIVVVQRVNGVDVHLVQRCVTWGTPIHPHGALVAQELGCHWEVQEVADFSCIRTVECRQHPSLFEVCVHLVKRPVEIVG